ncbi:MAG TPA: tetratricopeptide repeat protein [Candidatus Eisenbacteria bacterium]|nr:tetratricopeptide repeat protein [Candidatus Eisenbacteria bacterium]
MFQVSLFDPPQTEAQAQKPAPSFAMLSTQAQAARDADRLDEAAVLYRKALALKPGWAEGWWALGTIQYDQNAYGDAAKSFTRLVALQPKSGTARVMLGLCQFELGQDAAALASLQEGRRLGIPTDPQFREVMLYHEGVLLQREARFESAQEILGQLCRQSPYPPQVNLAMGAVALRVHDRQLPAAGTVDYQVMQNSGEATCLGAQRKYDDARRQFDALVAAYPQYPDLHYAYGKLLLDADDNDAAVAQFQAEIRNNPNDAISRLRIASAKYRIDSAAGLPYAEEAVKLDPSLPLGHYLLGLLLLDTDDYQRAIPELEIAQKAFSDQPKVYFALASAYSRAGRHDDAARTRATFLRLSKEQENSAARGTTPQTEGPPVPPRQ